MRNIEKYTQNFNDIDPADFTVMVVDDVGANVMLVNMMLTRAGFNVVKTTDSTEVLTLAKECQPDLFLLDILMPKLDGYALAEQLKSDPELALVPIIFLTAYEDKESMVRGFQVGASDYLTKPFEADILLARVRSQLKLVASRNIIEAQNENLKEIIYGRDKMYSVIAHDLRSPLGTIKMSLKALEDIMRESQADEMLTELVVESNKQVGELFNLLDNLLKWTKSQTGTLKVVKQDFDISTVVTSMLDMYQSIAAQKGINLKIDNETWVESRVRADVDMCNTMLRNLISNAIKFTERGKEITISCTRHENYAVLGVHDQGCGISEEDQMKLFDKDTHFTKYGTAREEGSGLGLLLCKDFVERIGGYLILKSVVNEGSSFMLYIPMV